MSRKFQVKSVPSTWLENNGRRLDCGPYLSGAIEARELLKRIKSESLDSLTHGYNGGIFNGPQFVRNYVNDPTHGVPFLTTSTMLQADMTNLPMISAKDALSAKLSYLRVEESMTLISCSGSIGRMAYARKELAGCWSNQDIMKVVADPSKVSPGYLYAYLSSRFGVPLIASGTYGAIIQHIEPHHIATIPVPRLGEIEQEANKLVEKAASLRSSASETVHNAKKRMKREASLAELSMNTDTLFNISVVSSTDVFSRLEGFFHSDYHSDAKDAIYGSAYGSSKVADIAQSIVEPTRFKRIEVEPSETSVPFFGTSALLWATPKPIYHLSERQRDISDYLVSGHTILIPRSGQISGLIGSAILPYGELLGGAITEDAIRINCVDETDAGYLFVALSSEYGERQLKARAYGSSIPHLDVTQIGLVEVPKLPDKIRNEIGIAGLNSAIMRGEAIELEQQAIALVERSIEEKAR